MAIQLDLQDSKFNVPFVGAYFRISLSAISRTRYEDTKHIVLLDVMGYATHPNAETQSVDSRRYHTSLDEIEILEGNTFLEKCYKWVMTQPDMAGSVAV